MSSMQSSPVVRMRCHRKKTGLHVNYLAWTHCSNKQTTKALFLLKTYPRWIGQLSESAVLKKWLRDLGSFHCVSGTGGGRRSYRFGGPPSQSFPGWSVTVERKHVEVCGRLCSRQWSRLTWCWDVAMVGLFMKKMHVCLRCFEESNLGK